MRFQQCDLWGRRHPINVWLGRLICSLAIIMAVASVAPAQESVRAWGLAGAYTAAARGLDAVAWNPANLALDDGHAIGLASASLDLNNNSFTLSRYNEISGATLSEADEAQLLADIPAVGLLLNADVHASALGFRSGPFAITSQAMGGAGGQLDKDFFDLVLLGNEVDRQFSFANTNGEGYAVAALTFTYAQSLLELPANKLAAGINLRYLQGIYESHVVEASGGLHTDWLSVIGDARAELATAEGGKGYGVDLGLSWQAPGGYNFGLALDNALSSMTWDGNPERHLWSVHADTISLANGNLSSALTTRDTTRSAEAYQTSLPRRLRVGASRKFNSTLLSMDLSQGLETRAGTSNQCAMSVGLEEQGLGWLQPRLGLCFGGHHGRGIAIGAGMRLGPWRLDLAAMNRGGFVPYDTKGLALAAGTSLEF